MNANELRALADALDPSGKVLTHPGDSALQRAADYLRAQADAQPVAWIAHNLTTGHVKWTTDRYRARVWTRVANLRVRPLYPAPAAPQAEPIDPHMIVAEDRFPDVPAERWKPCPQCGEDFDRECPICDGLGRVLATDGEQVEPKRDWSTIDAAIREYLDNYELIGEDDSGADACYTPTERELYLIYDAINGLLADESFVAAISAPQAEPKREPLSEWRIGELHRQWLANPETVTIADLMRAVERAHGIGGSDE